MWVHFCHECVQDTIKLLDFHLLQGFGVRDNTFLEVYSEQVILKPASLELPFRVDAPYGADGVRTDTVNEDLRSKLRKTRAEQHLRNRVWQIVEPRRLIATCVVVAREHWHRFQIRAEPDASFCFK